MMMNQYLTKKTKENIWNCIPWSFIRNEAFNAKALSCTNRKSISWDKKILSLCLTIWIRSPSNNQQLRKSNVLIMPSGGITTQVSLWFRTRNSLTWYLITLFWLRCIDRKKVCLDEYIKLCKTLYNVRTWKMVMVCLGHLSHSGDLLLWDGVRRRPSCVNIFFSRTTGPILTKFGM